MDILVWPMLCPCSYSFSSPLQQCIVFYLICPFVVLYSKQIFRCWGFLIVFSFDFVSVGCVVLYTAQGKFHGSTSNTLEYVVSQADFTAENLRNVSDYLDAAKNIGVDAVFLPGDVQNNIDNVKTKINSSAVELSTKTKDNSEKIKDGIDGM